MYWFTADLHLWHKNIIKYCNRPFNTVEEMNETIIKNWNERVKDGDTVYCVGDFAFKKIRDCISRLKGNIVFIKGSHDHKIGKKRLAGKYLELLLEGKKILLIHEPYNLPEGYDLYLTAHVHNKWKIKFENNKIICNVGTDVWDFKPVSLAEILEAIEKEKQAANK